MTGNYKYVYSVLEHYQDTRKEEEKEEDVKGIKIGEKAFNSQHNKDESKLHHSSLNPYGSEIQGNLGGSEGIEFIEDPLERKKKVNEVISRVELNLMNDDDFNSHHSDSQQPSALNTIDEARKHALKQQIKHDFLNSIVKKRK